MNWNNSTFTWPASTDAIHTDVDNMLVSADSELTTAYTRLGNVPDLSFSKNPVATSVTNAAATQQTLSELLDNGGHYLVVHPWQQGVGEGQGVYRYLSPPNAVEQLAAKFTDQYDSRRPAGDQEALALLICAVSLVDFATKLSAFNAVFPLPEIKLAQRRCEQLSTFERDKLVLPSAAGNARWVSRHQMQNVVSRDSFQALGNQLALATAYDSENVTPVSELENLIVKKQSQLSDLETNYQSLVARFDGGVGYSLFIDSASPETLAASVQAAGGPGYEYVFCVAVLFVAPPGNLTFLKEVFGL